MVSPACRQLIWGFPLQLLSLEISFNNNNKKKPQQNKTPEIAQGDFQPTYYCWQHFTRTQVICYFLAVCLQEHPQHGEPFTDIQAVLGHNFLYYRKSTYFALGVR